MSHLGICFLGAGGSTAETIDAVLGLDRLTSRNPHLHLQQVTSDPPNDGDGYFHAQHYHTVYVDQGTQFPVARIFRARLSALYGAGTALNVNDIATNVRNAMQRNPANFTGEDIKLEPPFSILSTATLNVNVLLSYQ